MRNLQVSVLGMVLWMKLLGFCYFFDPQHYAGFAVLCVHIAHYIFMEPRLIFSADFVVTV